MPEPTDGVVTATELADLYRRLAELALMCRRTAHDANSAITSILLRLEIADREPASNPRDVAALRRAFKQVARAIARLEASTRRWCDVPLPRVLERAIRIAGVEGMTSVAIAGNVPPSACLACNELELTQLLIDVFRHALATEASRIEVAVAPAPLGRVTIRVLDDGHQIRPDLIDAVLETLGGDLQIARTAGSIRIVTITAQGVE